MRGLALARYHVLAKLRSSWGVFAVALILAALPLLRDTLFMTSEDWDEIDLALITRANIVTMTYVLHLLVLLMACDLFGTPRSSRDGTRHADLLDTAPITPAGRFFGDAAGIFECAGVIHLCTLPLLAYAVALSPLPTSTFFWLEGIVLAAIVFVSVSASWKLRSTGKWMRTRTARSLALFFILVLAVLITTTQWETFRDAVLWAVINPSPPAWAQARAAVNRPALLVGSLVALYAVYIFYYAFSSIRAMERAEENAHAL